MLQKSKAFTLIELLIVVSIIMIVLVGGTISFVRFLDSQKININLEKLTSDIKSLDIKVKNHEIFDYEVFFNTGSLGYYYYINNFDLPYNQLLSFDFDSGTGVISTTASIDGGVRLLKIYKKHKLYLEKIFNATDTFTGNFKEADNYRVLGTLSGKILNEIGITYYINGNIIKEIGGHLTLSNIYENENKTGECLSSFKIVNIGGRKEIYCGLANINSAYLYFEQGGINKIIKINK